MCYLKTGQLDVWAFKIDMHFVRSAHERHRSQRIAMHTARSVPFRAKTSNGLNLEFSIHFTGFRPVAAMDLTTW